MNSKNISAPECDLEKSPQNAACNVFADIVQRRRSVRGFLATRLPVNQLQAIFSLACLAPSNCNTQPWLVYVISGDILRRTRKALIKSVHDGERTQDFSDNFDKYPPGAPLTRKFDSATRLYQAMNIDRCDKEGRQQALMRNFNFFGAPHVAFLCLPEWAGAREAADLGIYAQTLMLAMTAHGVGSCPQGAVGLYVEPIKRMLGIPEAHKLMFAISFGLEDSSMPANAARTPRAPLEETTFFLDN